MLTLAQGMPVLYALNVEIDIKTMCIEAGITQVQLANMLGITPAYVNRIIRQKETVVAIARTEQLMSAGEAAVCCIILSRANDRIYAELPLPDGSYDATIVVEQTRPIEFLLESR